MALSRRLLGPQEDELIHMRTHPKALVGPVLVLIVVVAGEGTALGLMPPDLGAWVPWAVVVLGAVLLVVGTVIPWLRWLTTTYTVTTRRIITRRGIFTRTGHDLPLTRINDVSYERSLLDRMLGCGTLVLTTAADAPVTLSDVPHVEQVHLEMNEVLFEDPPQSTSTAS
ncbi:PH domain-containing protein [Acidipropionibacterium virtanenii]|uniref:YdbS-like PH domain-containing protein n=1 Tax=Acidipropionibacterium virtanenii TaxID=2057246 RepID=A0A344USL8_9ACTN|nr:PH domain-containing protein [Acidipropionibacterium virtanenii]AXE38266.1 hypothetical protein JS278_01083 [Acidipropionibacterium virtanenii]